jgi:PncC family amidohydrolase
MGKIMSEHDILASLSQILCDRNETLAVAESVTAGGLQKIFSPAPSAMNFFQGGITCYNIYQKNTHLKVNLEEAKACNGVSPGVAHQMAKGVREMFDSTWGIGITGYASPVPELGIRLLYCHYCIMKHDREIINQRIDSPFAGMKESQAYYCLKIIESFNESLTKN